MKRSNLVDSMLCKYPSILIGLIIAAASVFPLAAPAMAAPNISISKASSLSSKSVMAGSDATYSITISNTATGTAANDTAHKVNITDTLPVGFTYKSQTMPAGVTSAHSGNNLSWNILTIAPNSSITISFVASTTANTDIKKHDNSATATFFKTAATAISGASRQTKAFDGNSSATDDVSITPTLVVTNTSPTNSIPIGEDATYNITVENRGSSAATGIKVMDSLPTGFKYKSQTISKTGTANTLAVTSSNTVGSASLTWNISTIPANSSITISLVASTVGAAKGKYDNPVNIEYFTTGSSIKKTAAYTGNDTTATAEDVTLTPLPSLSVSNATLSGYIATGSTTLYQITVKNDSEGKAFNTKITDALPTGFQYNKELAIFTEGTVTPSATKSYVKPALNDTAPKWENYDIAPGGKVTIYFTATGTIPSNATASQKFNNSVNVAYTSTPTGTNTLTANFDGTSSTLDDVNVKPVPPQPVLGNATRSASALAFTPETFCSDKPGGDGIAGNITGIVNTYFQPALAAVAAGTKEINIVAGAAKGKIKKFNDQPISLSNPAVDIKAGDLLLIVQMQDATINSANNDSYGSGNNINQGSGQSSMGNTGMYEYAVADSDVSSASGGTTLKLKKPLINSYVSSDITKNSDGAVVAGQKRFQVVRVPQYASVTVLGTLFASPWDGNVGGILAVDAFGKFNLNNQRMSVNSAGFRGGFGLQNGGFDAESTIVKPTSIYEMDSSGRVSVDATSGAPISITTARTAGSGKGEGTAGTPRFISTQALSDVDPIDGRPVWAGGALDNIVEGYPGGDTGRGAPANAGGAGNYHNAGGGGGGNGGIGGQGGLSWSSGTSFVNKDTGGRPGSLSSVNNPVPWQIIMGGGGGGGDANNSPQGVPGGAGGGIVMLRAGEIVGSGQIFANGRDGDRGAYLGAPDGAGGAGAGGTVVIQSRNASSANLTIQANGGNGGSTERDDLHGATPHGPGGGGAGGVVLYNIPGATINASVSGGAPGQTAAPVADDYTAAKAQTRNPFGATAGSDGIKTAFSSSEDPFSSLNNVTDCSPKLTMTNTAMTPKVEQGNIAKFKIKVTNTAKIGSAIDVTINNPSLATGFTYVKTEDNGIILNSGTSDATRSTTPSNPAVGSTTPAWGKFTIPPGGIVEINYQVLVGRTVPVGDYDTNARTSYPNPLRDAANINAVIEDNYDVNSSKDDNVEVLKRESKEMVWDLSPTIRVVRK
jgi:uncharacterized repeat protein (TIGR01451 family)